MNPRTERSAAALDGVVARLYRQHEPPVASPVDAESIVALAEGRLAGAERTDLVARIKQNTAARRELLELYPELFDALLDAPNASVGGTPRGARVLPFPVRWAAGGAGLVLAAAAALLVFVPRPAPPVGSRFEVVAASEATFKERGHAVTPDGATAGLRGDVILVAPGQRLQLLMRLGAPNGFDRRLRGATAAGALFMVDHTGRARLICTDHGGCPSSADTLAHLFLAPTQTGATTWFAFVSSSTAIDAAEARALADAANAAGGGWDALRGVLSKKAAEARWNVLEQPPVRVTP